MSKRLTIAIACIAAGVMVTTTQAKDWETDFEKAAATAKKAGKYMLLDFSGSDWCGWCIKLDKEVFRKAEFQAYAKDSLVCVLVDFPRGKKLDAALAKQNRELADKYQIRGFPSIIILSPKGDVVGRTGYQPGGAPNYVEHVKGIIRKHKK